MPYARFDDLTPGAETSFELVDLVDVVMATTPGDVLGALHEVESAVRRGMWAAGYVTYEAAPGLDPALPVKGEPADDPAGTGGVGEDGGPPLVWFGVFRHRREVGRLTPRQMRPAPYHISAWRSEVERTEYDEQVDRIRRHIEMGETYQVNYTFRLSAAFSGDAFQLYRDLALAQRGAYGAYLDIGRHAIVSASPELFYAQEGSHIEVRPMKGTIARGRWPGEDRLLGDELARSSKDRAENLMIVDLLRNDLGRIAEFGSVQVHDLFSLERYETVWQLTSRISATVRPDVGLPGLFTALFPSGSVTGAPKRRTMELITEIERSRRGVYCGAVGYLAPGDGGPGRTVFNVAIRTVTVDKTEGAARYGVGGGITWDSRSESEYEEARVKAQLLAERRPEFSLLETIRWDPGTGFAWRDRHIDRILGSAEYFRFPAERATLEAVLDDAVAGAVEPNRVRLLVRRDGAAEAMALPHPVRFSDGPDAGGEPLGFAIDDAPVSPQNVLLFHKTTARGTYDERLKRHPYADDVVLVNDRGEVTEFTIGNLAVLRDGLWVTPHLDSGCLPGIYREVLLGRGLLHEAVVTRDDLLTADAVAFLNSVQGWRPAQPVRVSPAPLVAAGGGG